MPTIAIVCTLNELRPYSIQSAKQGMNMRYFSVNVSVSFTAAGGSGQPVPEVFQPWQWLPASIKFNAYTDNLAAGAMNPPAGALIPQNFISPPLVSATTLPDTPRKIITDRLTKNYSDNVNTPNYLIWADQPGSTTGAVGENWSRLLAHASTYTAPIPHSINLTFLFKIPAAQLQKRLFIAPQFTANNVTYTPDPKGPKTPDQFGGVEWPYLNPPVPMSVFQREFALQDLTIQPSKSYIDFDTYLIATFNGNDLPPNPPESLASEDWRTTLERRAAEAFDLPQRTLVALRGAYFPAQGTGTTLPSPSDLTKIRDALLASMRDSADFGLRVAPDGANLLNYVLQRAVKDLAPADVSTYAAALTPADAKLSIDDWKKSLTKVLGLSSVNDSITDSSQTLSVLNALDTVRRTLAQDDNLALLLFAQWDAALTGIGNWAKIRLLVQQELSDLSSSHTLRSRYLLANLGGGADASVPVWKVLIDMHGASGYAAEKQQINTNFSALLPAYFRGRMIESSNSNDALFNKRFPACNWPQTVKPSVTDLSTSLQADAAKTDLAPDFKAQPTRVPHPAIIQIGDTQTGDDLTDPTRQIAGVGLLIKEQNPGTTYWTSANVANVYVRSTDGTFTQCLSGMFVPVRATTRNSLKQPFLVYNSGSLVGQDALVDQHGAQSDPASDDMQPLAGVFPSGTDKDDWQHLFQYRIDPPNCTVTLNGSTLKLPTFVPPNGSDWKRVPSLKVNQNVQETFLPFVIGAGGALPPLLAVSLDDPITPVSPTQFETSWNASGLHGYLRTITYLRRVGVGKVRLRRQSSTDTDIQHDLPDFPSKVVPMAQDLGLTKTQPSGSGKQVRSTPILLLWTTSDAEKALNGDHATFNFKVRPPACDLETFDRWVAGLEDQQHAYRNTRISVATGIRFGGPKAQAGLPPVENGFGPDFSIDDPAVMTLTFNLTQVFPKPGPSDPVVPPVTKNLKALSQLSSDVTIDPSNIAASLLAPVQSPGVKVLCSIGSPGCQPNDPNPDTPLNVTVPKGQVWQLTVAPGVSDTAKFEGFAGNSKGGNFELLIESVDEGSFGVSTPATTQAAVQESLWQSIMPAFGTDGTVSATFNAPVFNPPTKDLNLIRFVDLRRQSWRWTGRPVSPLPSDWNGGNIDADPACSATDPCVPNSMLWEVGSFGERDDEDAGTIDKAVNYLLQPKAAINLFSTSLAKDLRAQFWRFAVNVHSRYEGLPGLQIGPLTARHAVKDPDGISTGFTEWRRLAVPPRLKSTVAGVPSAPVPKPKILMTIPLTQPHNPATSNTLETPEMLVVVNEPWFQLGGLAEELRAELEPARDPNVPLSFPTSAANPIAEIGPAQTLTGKPSDVVFGASTLIAAEPIGATFDLATSAPLFGNCCFKLKSSMLNWNGQFPPSSKMEHFQAKVRFRRVINATKWGGTDDLQSDSTDACLVEFQPSFIHCNVLGQGPIAMSDLTFSISGSSLSFSWRDAQLKWHTGAQLVPGPPRTDLFVPINLKLWVLVMQNITDAFGNHQLAPVDILPQSADGKSFTFSITPAKIPDQKNVVVYLLQVLDVGTTPHPPNTFKSLGALLFPDDQDTPVRIKGCSSKITFQTVS